jgi:hypothetical protein
MGQKKRSESVGGDKFPLVTVLVCMGLFTVVASIGLFAWITNQAAVLETADATQVEPGPGPVETAAPAIQDDRAAEPKSIDRASPDQPVELADRRGQQPPVSDPTPDPPAADSTQPPAPLVPESNGIPPGEMARWKSMLGLNATLEGVVVTEGESGSGKTRYIWFSSDRDNNAMAFMLTRDVGDDLSLDYLRSLRGKRVRVTGVVEEQFGTKRIGVRIQNQNQIQIVD